MDSRVKKNPDVSWQMIEGQAVLIHNRLGEIMVLNEVGSVVWQNLEDGVDKLVNRLTEEFDVSSEEAKKDIGEFFKELESSGAILLNQ